MTADFFEPCTRVRERLSARFDGEVAAGGLDLEHLGACPACREFAGSLPALAAHARGARAAGPPADLWSRIEARAVPAPAGSSGRPVAHGVSSGVARAAAALVGFLGVSGAGSALLPPRAPAGGVRPHPLAFLSALAEPAGGAPLRGVPEDHLLRAIAAREETDR